METFLVIGAVGLALLLVSLVLGDLVSGVLGGLFGAVGSGWFPTAALSGFVAAFGFAGAIAYGPLGTGPAVAVGAGAGLVFAWFAVWLTRLLKTDRTDAVPQADDAIGRDATVITAIPADGFGVVRVGVGGHTITYNAKTGDGPIEPGTPVHITGVLSPTAVTVAPTWRELTP